MKTLTSLILISFIGAIFAGDCATHPFKTVFPASFIPTQSDNAAQATLSYCKNLQTKATCCPTTAFQAVQTQIDAVKTTLSTGVGNRDKYLVESRDTSLLASGIQDKLKAIKTAGTTTVASLTAIAGTKVDQSLVRNAAAIKWINSLSAIVTDATDNLATLKSGFTAFQKARTTCIVQLLKLQAAAYCLACDKDYDTKGVSGTGPNPVIAFSTDVKSRIRTACFPYIKASDTQTNIILGRLISAVDAFSVAITKTNADPMGKDDIKTAITNLGLSAITASDKKPVQVPDSCTQDSCDWILTTWFANGQLATDSIIAGGAPDATFATTGADVTKSAGDANAARLLEQGRVLQTTWNPTEDEAGATITFPDDPASVNPDAETPSGSELMKSGLISLVMVMVSAFLI